MHPVCFKLGPLTVHAYGVMMALGFLAGLANWVILGRKENRDSTYCSDLLLWVVVSGILGARVAYVLANFADFAGEWHKIIFVWEGGLIYYGGFAGAAVGLYLFASARRENFLGLTDFVVTSLPLAHAFGRVGCLLNGCCYGTEYAGWPAIRYPIRSLAWIYHVGAGRISQYDLHSLSVHPVQLYESLFNLLLFGLIAWFYRRRRTHGSSTALYLLVYPVGRFCLEFLRGDERIPWMGLSLAQGVSLALFLLGLGVLAVSRRGQNRIQRPAETSGVAG